MRKIFLYIFIIAPRVFSPELEEIVLPSITIENTYKAKRDSIYALLPNSRKYLTMDIYREVVKYNYPIDFIMRWIETESSFNFCVQSPKGAVGLIQIKPSTARAMCDTLGIIFYPDSLYNAGYNLKLGLFYLDRQIKKHGIKKGLICYNYGPRRRNVPFHELPEETQNYISKIM